MQTGRYINHHLRDFSALLLLLLGMIISPQLLAQDDSLPPDVNSQLDKANRPKSNTEESIRYLIRRDTKGILYGNTCAEDVTLDHHFYYVVMPKNAPGSVSGWQYFWHNTKTSFVLFFKNGPCWKRRVRKRIRQCKLKSGDYVG